MKFICSVVLLVLSLQLNAQHEEKLQLVAIMVDSLEISMDWYEKNLGFHLEDNIKSFPDHGMRLAMLEKEGFRLELIERKPSTNAQDHIKDGQTYMKGIIKIGFVVNNIDSVFQGMKTISEENILIPVNDLRSPKLGIVWPKKYFLIRDPDKNLIQFFSFKKAQPTAFWPWLIMLSTPNIDSTAEWYHKHLGFEIHKKKISTPVNQRQILSKGNVVLELFQPVNIIDPENIAGDENLLGFAKIGFSQIDVESFYQKVKNQPVNIEIPPEPGDFPWIRQTMIMKDYDHNWIQFIELNEK